MNYKSRFLIIAVMVGLIALGTLWADVWYNNYENALRAIEKKDWSSAIKYLYAALQDKKTPKLNTKTVGLRFVDYLPYYYMGLAFYSSGQYDEAAKYFEQSLNQGVIQHRKELLQKLDMMLNDCQVKLAPRLKENQKTAINNNSEAKDTKTDDVITSSVTPKPTNATPDNSSSTSPTTTPVTPTPTDTMVPRANLVEPLLVDGANLYKLGDLSAAKEKFNAVLRLDARHPGASKWLKKITLAMGIRDLNQCIHIYFAGDRMACERNLRQVIEVFLNENDKKSLTVAYQFLAVILIERHLLEDDTDGKLLLEAKQYIIKIKTIEPHFQLEERYFSPKVVRIFAEK